MARKLIGTTDMARVLGCCESSVRRMADRGEIPVARVMPSGARQFDPDLAEALAKALQERGNAVDDTETEEPAEASETEADANDEEAPGLEAKEQDEQNRNETDEQADEGVDENPEGEEAD